MTFLGRLQRADTVARLFEGAGQGLRRLLGGVVRLGQTGGLSPGRLQGLAGLAQLVGHLPIGGDVPGRALKFADPLAGGA